MGASTAASLGFSASSQVSLASSARVIYEPAVPCRVPTDPVISRSLSLRRCESAHLKRRLTGIDGAQTGSVGCPQMYRWEPE